MTVHRWSLGLVACAGIVACGEAQPRTDSPVATGSVALASMDPASVMSAGDAAYGRAEYDSARAIYLRAHSLAADAGDTLTAARALTQVGLAAWRHGDYADARLYGERALALKVSARLTKELPKSNNALGLLAHNQGRFGEALDAFDRAEHAAESVGDSIWLAKVRGNRALVFSDIGDFPKARDGFEALRRLGHDQADTTLEANALTNLGMVDVRAGDPRGALRRLTAALRLHRAIGNAVGEENALGQIGTAFQASGEPQIALAYLDSALAIARRHGLRQQESDDLQLIAALFGDAGEQVRALEYLGRAAPIADSMHMGKIEGDIARAQARALFALGDLRAARARAERAKTLHAAAGATLEQLEDELFVAELAQRDGQRPESDAAIASARAFAASIDSRVARIEVALGEARVAEVAGDPRRVLRSLGRVRDELGSANTGSDWEAPALAARAHATLGELDRAAGEGHRAVRAVERVRSNLTSGPLRASFTAARANVYGDLVLTLLRLGRSAEALTVADGARSRALLEHIAAAGRDSTRPGFAADLVTAEQLLRRIDQLVERLRTADTAAPRRRARPDDGATFLSRQLAAARRDYETLIRRANVADQRTSAIAGVALPNVAAIRAALEPGETLVEYFVTAERLVTFIVNAKGVRALEAPITDEALSGRIRLARDLLSRRDVAAATRDPVLRQLYAMLIQPANDAGRLDGTHTLVIVPHSTLSYLPFAALLDPASGRYLIQRFNVLVLPSATSLAAVRRAPSVAGNDIAAATAFAPFPDELPGTREEADAVGRGRAGGRTYIGAEATERAIRMALAEPQPVHVATHGVLNPRSPMFSRIEIARPPGARGAPVPGDDDGRLEVHELLDLTIRSPLVFLSGCETGVGPAWSTSFMRGDDYATLAEAFLFAGARNVVSTLWRIEDKTAALFAARFYAEEPRGTLVEAMARAQRAMLADPDHASPYYWAAYVLTGDGRPLTAQNRLRAAVP